MGDDSYPEETAGEFWSSRQRQGSSLHEISYRACFKPELPEYFISRFSSPSGLVADPFLGRGTTALQAALMGRNAAGSDINPLSAMLVRPRFFPPLIAETERRAEEILASDIFCPKEPLAEDLLAFYHPETLADLLKFKNWFAEKETQSGLDRTDDWLRMICLSRLSGHSPGFFSVRTMPPNQAVSAEAQRRINKKSGLNPEPKNITEIAIKKSRSLLRSPNSSASLADSAAAPILHTASADNLFYLQDTSVDLIVTSPPFLNVVDYRKDNWLRCWFANIDADKLNIGVYSSLSEWRAFIRASLAEIARVLKKGSYAAFEVGEIRSGKTHLEAEVLQAAKNLPLNPERVLINQHKFTKTSNLWGVRNNKSGTNTNRVILFSKI